VRRRLPWCCALLLALTPAAWADEPPASEQPPSDRPMPHVSDWLPDPGGVQVGRDGLARSIFQPEFRDARALAERLLLHVIKGLTVVPIPPFVAVPPDKPGGPAKPPVPTRLLLTGSAEAVVVRARAILERLDVPPRSAFISILASEVRRWSGKESGGSLLYDRGAGTDPKNTIFRGFSTAFEPDSYLRSSLTGVVPFEGTTLRFGELDAGGGAFEYTLRMLSKIGCAEFIAWPNLVVHEGTPATMEVLRVLPQTILDSSVNGKIHIEGREVGLKLRLTPIRIGRDSAVLDLDVWLRIPEELNDNTGLVGTLRLKLRQVRTRITLRDREPLMLGGLVLHRATKKRRGLKRPPELKVLDPLHSALTRDGRDTEVTFLIRMRCVTPGRTPAEMRPGVYRGWSQGKTRTDPFGK